MTKAETFFSLGSINLTKRAVAPMYQQLYEQIRSAILESKLKPGSRIPPTRALASELGISRNTVVFAFEQLIAEGYVHGKVGTGSYVTDSLPDQGLLLADDSGSPIKKKDASKSAPISEEAKVIQSLSIPSGISIPIPFRSGIPALDEFPFKIWGKLSSRRYKKLDITTLCYTYHGGYQPLRETIAAYLGTSRGVVCEPEQIIIVNGTQQGFQLVCQLLTDPGDGVLVEDPCYPNAIKLFLANQLNVVPVPVDQKGLRLEEKTIENSKNPRLVYTTPSFQFPLGYKMALERRLDLIRLAKKHELWVIEDDYDSEYRYRGKPLNALQGLDQDGNIIYLGTFSKVLFPSLRIGYLVVPKHLIELFIKALAVNSRGVPILNQAILADFILEGHFARHIRRMRMLYTERQEILLELIKKELNGALDAQRLEAGLHLTATLIHHNDVQLSKELLSKDIVAPAVSSFCRNKTGHNGLVLGYAGLNKQQMREGIEKISKAIG